MTLSDNNSLPMQHIHRTKVVEYSAPCQTAITSQIRLQGKYLILSHIVFKRLNCWPQFNAAYACYELIISRISYPKLTKLAIFKPDSFMRNNQTKHLFKFELRTTLALRWFKKNNKKCLVNAPRTRQKWKPSRWLPFLPGTRSIN